MTRQNPEYYEVLECSTYNWYPTHTVILGDTKKSCHKWHSRYNVRNGTQKLLPWSKDVLYFMMQQQYDSFLLHSSVLEFERDFFMDEPLRLPSYHPQWHQGILHSVRYPRYPPDEHPLDMQNAMLRFKVPRPIIRNALQITTTGLLDVIYDTGAVMTMITDHGTGYMTNKKETTHQVTGLSLIHI